MKNKHKEPLQQKKLTEYRIKRIEDRYYLQCKESVCITKGIWPIRKITNTVDWCCIFEKDALTSDRSDNFEIFRHKNRNRYMFRYTKEYTKMISEDFIEDFPNINEYGADDIIYLTHNILGES